MAEKTAARKQETRANVKDIHKLTPSPEPSHCGSTDSHPPRIGHAAPETLY